MSKVEGSKPIHPINHIFVLLLPCCRLSTSTNGCNQLACTGLVVVGIGGSPLVCRCCSAELLLCLCSASLGCKAVVLGPRSSLKSSWRGAGGGHPGGTCVCLEGSEIKRRRIKEAVKASRCWSCWSCWNWHQGRSAVDGDLTWSLPPFQPMTRKDQGMLGGHWLRCVEVRGGHGKVLVGCKRVKVVEEQRAAASPGDGVELAGRRSLPRTPVSPGCRRTNHWHNKAVEVPLAQQEAPNPTALYHAALQPEERFAFLKQTPSCLEVTG